MKRESSNIDPEIQPQRLLKITSFKKTQNIAWGFASNYQKGTSLGKLTTSFLLHTDENCVLTGSEFRETGWRVPDQMTAAIQVEQHKSKIKLCH